MRIGYLTYGLDRSPTGIGRYTIELVKALAALNTKHEIVLLSTEREDKHGIWDHFEHHHLSGCRLLPALMTVGNALLSLAAKRYRLDLIHDPNGIAPFLGPSMAARRVVTIHDTFAYVVPETHTVLDNWRYRYMLPLALRKADMVLTDSRQSCLDIQNYFSIPETKTKTIPLGVHPTFQPVRNNGDCQDILTRYGIPQPYLLYVGGINARKNIARLFEAYARIRQQHPALKLVMGGKRQWQTGEIEATFQRLNLGDGVHFTGYLNQADLPAIYSGAEAFVFPSLYEGFGLPPLEAMACGTPVVTSNVSSLPEVVGEAAITVDPLDIESLAGAIDRVLTDKNLHTELRLKGIERAKQFTWEQTARETMAAYEWVMLA